MHVTAVVEVGGRRGAPDLLTPIGGVSILVRSVRLLLESGLLARVVLAGGGVRTAELVAACAGLPVDAHERPWRAGSASGAHIGQRALTPFGDGATPRVLLVHDAARPLAPSALVGEVLAAVADGADSVVPVLPLSDTVKIVDSAGLVRGSPDRAGLRVVQTPRAFRLGSPSVSDPSGAVTHTVPGHPLAFAITGAWDLELAELLVAEEEA